MTSAQPTSHQSDGKVPSHRKGVTATSHQSDGKVPSHRKGVTATSRHVVAAILVLLFTLFALPAQAGEVREIDSLLSSWQMEEADRRIDALEKADPADPDVLYLRARYDFFQGDYAAAVDRLDQALTQSPRDDWKALREVVSSTHEVTKDYSRHISPSGHFVVYLEPGKDEVLLPYAFEALDAAYEEIGEELGYRPPTPIRVEVYPSAATLAKVSVLTEDEIKTSGTIALCKYNRLMITSPKALLRGYTWVDTLVHEYVHYVINRKTENRVPIWMHEGLAKFLERRWRGADAHRLSPSSEAMLQERVEKRDLITFAQMHPSMAKLPSQEDAAVAFAEVYTAMEYLKEKAGPNAFGRLLDEISAGADAQDAFAGVLGTSFAAFERDWKGALATRPKVKIPDEDAWKERLVFKDEGGRSDSELDEIDQPAARDHMHLGEMLQARERFGAAVVQYRKASRLMGTENPVLQARLAESLLAMSQPKEAIAALAEVRELYPSYIKTWLQLGRASIAVGDWQAAEGYLKEAARINPFDPAVHEALAKVWVKLGKLELAEKARGYVDMVR